MLNELKSLTLNGKKYDSFVDQEARKNAGGGTSIDVTAQVGQTIVVKEVDANGKPTAWESADYQPRTHWEETTTILPEFTGENNPDLGFVMIPQFSVDNGNEYIVVYNGTEYPCTAIVVEDAGSKEQILGNYLAAEGVGDTGHPFLIACHITPEDSVYACVPLDGASSVTLSIIGDVVTQLPTKYIDETWIKTIALSAMESLKTEIDEKNAEQDIDIGNLQIFNTHGNVSIDRSEPNVIDGGWFSTTVPAIEQIVKNRDVDLIIRLYETPGLMDDYLVLSKNCTFTYDFNRKSYSTFFIHLLDTTETVNNALAVRIIARESEIKYRIDTITI